MVIDIRFSSDKCRCRLAIYLLYGFTSGIGIRFLPNYCLNSICWIQSLIKILNQEQTRSPMLGYWVIDHLFTGIAWSETTITMPSSHQWGHSMVNMWSLHFSFFIWYHIASSLDYVLPYLGTCDCLISIKHWC